MAQQAATLQTRGLGKTYPGGERALVDVDLEVHAGETVALIGESGSGKTTLLRMFNRMLRPTAGAVRINGETAESLDAVQLRRRTGYVPQHGGLLPHWTVRRNVELVPRLLGWPANRRIARASELLSLVGLDPERFAARYPAELSGGQRQRVAFARAVAAEPMLLLLDEPFGALDAITRLELQEEFVSWQERLRRTVVLVTHDLAEAFRLADRIAVLRGGRLLQLGTAADLRSDPADPYVRELVSRLRLEGDAGEPS